MSYIEITSFYLFLRLYFLFLNKFYSFVTFPLPSSLYAAWVSGNIHIFKKRRLLRFCLWCFETSQLLNSSQRIKATVDVYGVCYISLVHLCCVNIRCTLSLYISAWAISALLVQTVIGNAKASECGTSNRYKIPALFLFIWINLNLSIMNHPVLGSLLEH